jgi:hypothetical protein
MVCGVTPALRITIYNFLQAAADVNTTLFLHEISIVDLLQLLGSFRSFERYGEDSFR